jgi:hypothetical protein
MNQQHSFNLFKRVQRGLQTGQHKRANAELQGRLGSVTRFAKDYQIEPDDKFTKMGIASRTVPASTIIEACRLKDKGFPLKQIAAHLNVPEGTVHSWVYRRVLPKTGRYTVETYRLVLYKARAMWQAGLGSPRKCFRKAAMDQGMCWRSVRVHLCMESIPAIPGFPLYASPETQVRAGLVGLGKLAGASPVAFGLKPNDKALPHQPSRPVNGGGRRAGRSSTRR